METCEYKINARNELRFVSGPNYFATFDLLKIIPRMLTSSLSKEVDTFIMQEEEEGTYRN